MSISDSVDAVSGTSVSGIPGSVSDDRRRSSIGLSGRDESVHWSFRAPIRPALPAVENRRWARNPIDLFVLARLERERVAPSPEADQRALLRRLWLDLAGLPPAPAQVEQFVLDPRPDAYERQVDALLASPHFGERWGRHWLDLARYADTSGYQIDRPRPGAWVYRDWVIDAINRDLPFDQFTIEQLAGDLIPNASVPQKVAAGFHRLTLMNHEDGVDAEEFKCKARVDRVAVTGTVWLGLTLGCAECHSHKYDPISQREFYQLYACFNNADEVDIAVPQTADSNAVAHTFAEKPKMPSANIHLRGDFLRLGDAVDPGVPAALSLAGKCGSISNRLDLARWIVDSRNPLTARVAVNQIWQHLFGQGLVATPDDFGVRGEPPTHPELLDWLATEFVARQWSRKAMIRLIVTSAAYRQSSRGRLDLADRDPLNRLVARQNRFRLESEIVRDASLAAGGLLNPKIGGPSFRPETTVDFKELGAAGAFSWRDDHGTNLFRRGLYIYAQRTVPYPTAMTLDQANPTECCPRRERSNTPLQALTLLNHGLFVQSAEGLARRMNEDARASDRDKIKRGYLWTVGRLPVPEESQCLERLIAEELHLASLKTTASSPLRPFRKKDDLAWTIVAQMLLNTDEFLTRE